MQSRIVAVLAALAPTLCVATKAAEPQILHVELKSRLLSAFWGQPVTMEASVLLPDSYYQQPNRQYPVVYWIS